MWTCEKCFKEENHAKKKLNLKTLLLLFLAIHFLTSDMGKKTVSSFYKLKITFSKQCMKNTKLALLWDIINQFYNNRCVLPSTLFMAEELSSMNGKMYSEFPSHIATVLTLIWSLFLNWSLWDLVKAPSGCSSGNPWESSC